MRSIPVRAGLAAAALLVGVAGCGPTANSGTDDAAASPRGGEFGFEPRRVTELAHDVSRLVPADLDRDGRAELLVTHEQVDEKAARLTLLRSGARDDAGLFAATALPAGGEEVAIADLDGDGVLDLVVGAAKDEGKVWLYRGAGDASFAAPVAHTTKARGPAALALADLDADRDLDIAAWNSSRDVSVLRGDGRGGFAAATRSVDFGREARGMAALDLADDGASDLALAGYDELLLARNDGSGEFPSAEVAGTGRAHPERLVVEDIDGDGHPDLVGAGLRALSIRTADGQGGLRELASVPVDPTMSDFAVGDLDGDGRPELIVGSGRSGVTVYAGELTGEGYRERLKVAVPGGLNGLAVADFDGDCALDVATVANRQLSVLINSRPSSCPDTTAAPATPSDEAFPAPEATPFGLPGGRTFAAPVRTTVGAGTSDALLADLTGDGRLDLIVNGWYQRRLLVQLGEDGGRFGRTRVIPVPALAQPSPQPCNDVIEVDAETGEVIGGQGRPVSAALASRPALPMSCASRDDIPSGLAAADLDGDGHVDLLTGTQFGGSVAVLRGDGTGSFAPQRRYPAATGGPVWDVAIGDFNGDKAPDVLAQTGAAPVLLLNDGRGGLRSGRLVGDAGEPVVGDLDGDGDLDLAVFQRGSKAASVQVLINDGQARFTQAGPQRRRLPTGPDMGAPALADADSDGVLDALISAPDRRQVIVARGDGKGGFSDPAVLDTGGAYPYDLTVADLTGDQITDIVVLNADSNEIAVLAGDGEGSWTSPSPIPVEAAASLVFLEDLNSDGALDVITYHRGERRGFLSVRYATPR